MSEYSIQLVCACAFVGVAFVAAIFTAVTVFATRRVLETESGSFTAGAPSLLILRPCEGDEPELAERLRSGFAIRWPGPLMHVIAVGRALGSTAREAALRAEAKVLQSPIPTPGTNRKAHHLANAFAVYGDGADIVLAIDADVEVTDELVWELVARVARPGAAAAFACPIQNGTPAGSFIGRACLAGSPHSFATLAALARITRSVPPMVGCAVAYDRRALAAAGGFEAALRVIGDDLAMASALSRRGDVVVAPVVADCRDETKTAFGVIQQLARWIRVIVAHRPSLSATYPVLIAPMLPLTLLGILSAPILTAPAVVAGIGAVYALRVLHAAVARTRLFGHEYECVTDPWVGDLAWWVAMLLAVLPTATRWRGRRYRLGRGGVIAGSES